VRFARFDFVDCGLFFTRDWFVRRGPAAFFDLRVVITGSLLFSRPNCRRQILLEAREGSPDLIRSAQIGNGVGERVAILEP